MSKCTECLEQTYLNLLTQKGVAGIFGVTVSSEIPHFFVSETRHPPEMLGAFFSIFPASQKENRCKERSQPPWMGSSLASGHAFLPGRAGVRSSPLNIWQTMPRIGLGTFTPDHINEGSSRMLLQMPRTVSLLQIQFPEVIAALGKSPDDCPHLCWKAVPSSHDLAVS